MATMDLMAGSEWIRNLSIDENRYKELIKVLKGSKDGNYHRAAKEII